MTKPISFLSSPETKNISSLDPNKFISTLFMVERYYMKRVQQQLMDNGFTKLHPSIIHMMLFVPPNVTTLHLNILRMATICVSNVTYSLKKLVKNGYIDLDEIPGGDHRHKQITFTKRGQQMVALIHAVTSAYLEKADIDYLHLLKSFNNFNRLLKENPSHVFKGETK